MRVSPSSRLFVGLFVVDAVFVLVLDIVADVVPNLLPEYITQNPVVVGLLLVGLLIIVTVLRLGIKMAEDATGTGHDLPASALRLFAAFAGIAIGLGGGIGLAPTVIDYGETFLKSVAAFFEEPAIKLDPLSGPPGSLITVVGSHFARNTPVIVYAASTPMDSVRTDDAGNFSLKLRYPRDLATENQSNQVVRISADESGGKSREAVATFVVRVGP